MFTFGFVTLAVVAALLATPDRLKKPPLAAGLALSLVACSGGAIRAQATTAAVIARASNAGLALIAGEDGATKVSSLYESQQLDVARAACGDTKPCADPQAARDAVMAVRARWAPVWSAWALAGVAHATWADQLRRCQTAQANDGTECTIRLEQLTRSVVAQITTVRCALRGLGVTDPFPGEIACGGEQ